MRADEHTKGPRCRAVLVALGLGACGPYEPAGTGFQTPGTSSSAASSSSGSGTSGTSDTSTSTGDGSPSAASGASAEPRRDLGATPDLQVVPPGCQGKIDFLFLVSRHGFMAGRQAQLIDAFPKFIDTITTKFEDFDYHIMVVDGDAGWGLSYCTEQCPNIGPPPCTELEYPCHLLDQVTSCDRTEGAGVLFNAGSLAYNAPCTIPEGRRYLQKGDPDLAETFTCMAQGGASGGDRLGDSLVAAMSPQVREGCNAGFLRTDALLMLILVTEANDYDSEGTPEAWAQAVFDAKGKPDSIVTFGIVNQISQPWCDTYVDEWAPSRTCELIRRFPYHTSIDIDVPDYGPGFDAATDLVAEACAAFLPG